MLYASPARVLSTVATTLEQSVLPALDDRDARGQLWAAIGLLDNLAATSEQGTRALVEELLEVRALIAAAPAALPDASNASGPRADAGGPSAPDARRTLTIDAGRGIEPELAAAHADLNGLLAAAARTPERSEDVDAWLERCRALLTARNAEQVEGMRPTRYASAVRGD